MPSTNSPFGSRRGTLVDPSGKHGEQMFGPPNAKVVRPLSASISDDANGPDALGLSDGMPTYSVDQPLELRVARYGSGPRLAGDPTPGIAPEWIA